MTTPMTIQEIDRNPYLGRTKQIERPYADDPVRTYADPADLARHQRQWDQAKAWADEGRRRQDERIAAVDAERAAADEARRLAARADLEGAVKARFLSRPGVDEADWQRLGPELIDAELLAMPDPVAQARAELLKSGAFSL